MNDNPFIDPENPLGSYSLPYEEHPMQAASYDIRSMHDQAIVRGAVAATPLGTLPVLIFEFSNSASGPLDPVVFVASASTMMTFARVVMDSARSAANAAAKAGG